MPTNADELLNGLLAVRKELLNEIDDLTDEQLKQKPNEDKWSVSQVLGHLITLDKIMLPAFQSAIQGESEKIEEKDLDIVLNRTYKVKSPFREPPTDFQSRENLLQSLKEARMLLLEYLSEIVHETAIEGKSMMHPILGVISMKQMISFISLHEKRHIEQIKEIRQSVK